MANAPPRPALLVKMGEDGHLHVGPAGRLVVRVASFHYAYLVIDDLCLVDDAPGGPEILEALDASPHTVSIAPPAAPTTPPNASVAPDNPAHATAPGLPTGHATPDGYPILGTGTGCGSTILYDPAVWPWPGDPASPAGPGVLLALLQQAGVYGQGLDDPADERACL